jgi:proline iminopeptidase
MRTFYPQNEPYDQGQLNVGDGQAIYWESSGNPKGKPVVYLHGGPGGTSTPDARRQFDPARYRIILFDQRGTGKSTPHASEASADLSTNTTWHLVSDLEKLREHLGIENWQVFGGSWGSALALAYAETYPDRVTELVLRGIFTLRESELFWFYEGPAGQVFPEVWEQFVAQVPDATPGEYRAAYHELLFNPDPAVHTPAAIAWATWEASAITLLPCPDVVATFTEPAHAVAFARIENHYFMNLGWFNEGQLIRNAHLLRDIPTVIVQGRYDMCTPPVTAWELHKALPSAKFVMVPDAGHASYEPGILSALIEATDRFAGAASD